MGRHFLAFTLFLIACLTMSQAQAKEQKFTLKSPNGKLVTHIVGTDKDEITYDIEYNGATIMLP